MKIYCGLCTKKFHRDSLMRFINRNYIRLNEYRDFLICDVCYNVVEVEK